MPEAQLLFNLLFYYLPAVDFNVEGTVTTANSTVWFKKKKQTPKVVSRDQCWKQSAEREQEQRMKYVLEDRACSAPCLSFVESADSCGYWALARVVCPLNQALRMW